MTDFNEDFLLKVFKELDVQLLHLNPNVVKAWFDTDDKNMKNLLNWMCGSLSKKNYVSPLEMTEYLTISNPLCGVDLKRKKKEIEEQYPDIFDTESNSLEIEFLEEELNLARQQEKELDQSITLNRNLGEMLDRNLSKKFKEEIEASVKAKTTQEKCLAASEKLDEMNEKIFDRIVKSTNVLYNFEFGLTPMFISNFTINLYQERLENVMSLVKPVLEKSYCIGNMTALTNITNVDHVPLDETTTNNLCNMRHRLLHSHHKYLTTTIELEKMKNILADLEKISIETLLSCDERTLSQNIAMKMETRSRLCDMLEDASIKVADCYISQAQIKYMKQELEMHQSNLQELTEIDNMIKELLAHYSVLSILYDVERKEMERFEIFFKRIIKYMNRDMETCVIRTEQMKEIIQQYQSTAPEEKLHLMKMIINLLSSNEENVSIGRAYELITDFKKQIDFLEFKLFSPGFSEIKSKGKDLRDSVKTLQSFLISGPTHRILLIPAELQIVIRQVEELLKKELDSVASAMTTVSKMRKIPNKWQNYRRQLWMYFYADPNGLKFILQQIQKEYEESKKNQLS